MERGETGSKTRMETVWVLLALQRQNRQSYLNLAL
jgi:hypothetical protein